MALKHSRLGAFDSGGAVCPSVEVRLQHPYCRRPRLECVEAPLIPRSFVRIGANLLSVGLRGDDLQEQVLILWCRRYWCHE